MMNLKNIIILLIGLTIIFTIIKIWYFTPIINNILGSLIILTIGIYLISIYKNDE